MKKLLSVTSIFALILSTFILSVSAISAPFTTAEDAAEGRKLLNNNVVLDSIEFTEHFDNQSGANLFDNDTETKLCTDVYPALVSWKMDAKYAVTRILFATANDNESYPGRNPYNYTISGSNDNTTWKTIHKNAETDLEDVNITYYYVDVAGAEAYEYYKFECPEAEIGPALQISELVLCAAPAGAETVAPAAAEVTTVAETTVAPAPVQAPIDESTVAPVANETNEAAPAAATATQAPQTSDPISTAIIFAIIVAGGAVLAKKVKLI